VSLTVGMALVVDVADQCWLTNAAEVGEGGVKSVDCAVVCGYDWVMNMGAPYIIWSVMSQWRKSHQRSKMS
jgi:hypothetical protein